MLKVQSYLHSPGSEMEGTPALKRAVTSGIWKKFTKFSKHRSIYVVIMANSNHLLGMSSEVSFMPIWILDIATQSKKEQVFSMFLLDFAACTEFS